MFHILPVTLESLNSTISVMNQNLLALCEESRETRKILLSLKAKVDNGVSGNIMQEVAEDLLPEEPLDSVESVEAFDTFLRKNPDAALQLVRISNFKIGMF